MRLRVWPPAESVPTARGLRAGQRLHAGHPGGNLALRGGGPANAGCAACAAQAAAGQRMQQHQRLSSNQVSVEKKLKVQRRAAQNIYKYICQIISLLN